MKIKNIISLMVVFLIVFNSSSIYSQVLPETYKESTIVLVVGFGPFLNNPVNPSELIATALDGETINTAEIKSIIIQPNLSNFDESLNIIYQAIDDIQPDYIVPLGLAVNFTRIRIEKIGYNLKLESRENATIEPLIPKARFIQISHYPSLKIVHQLRKEGIPSRMTFFAGLSLCNGILYSVLHYIRENNLPIKSGFIHVPIHQSEEDPEGMPLSTMINATRIIISECLDFYE